MIHNDAVSIQVAACTYKNSVFFDCVFDRRSDDCCRLFVSLSINSATLNNVISHIYEQDSIVIPMEITLQSTEHKADAVLNYYLCGNVPLFHFDRFYAEIFVFSPLCCDFRQTCAIKALC